MRRKPFRIYPKAAIASLHTPFDIPLSPSLSVTRHGTDCTVAPVLHLYLAAAKDPDQDPCDQLLHPYAAKYFVTLELIPV